MQNTTIPTRKTSEIVRRLKDGSLLGVQIEPETLNHVINDKPYKEQSITFVLAATPEGCELLVYNNYGEQIEPEILNRIIEEGLNKGQSVAFLLAKTSQGRELLVRNNCLLGQKVREDTLNHIIEEGEFKA